MRKIVRKAALFIIILIGMLLVCEKVNAATINLDYNIEENAEKTKNLKIHPGDDVYISLSIEENQDEKIMAMYGVLEYDKDVLELVLDNADKDEAKISLNEGWTLGSVTIKDGKFMLYSADENRSNTAAYIKFKAKEKLDVTSTNIVIKNMVLFNNNYREILNKTEDVSLEVKISKSTRNAKKDILIMIIGIGCILLIILMIKNKTIIIRKAGDKLNNKIEEGSKSNSKIAEDKKKEIEKEDNVNDEKNSTINKTKNTKNNNKSEKVENVDDIKEKQNKEVVKNIEIVDSTENKKEEDKKDNINENKKEPKEDQEDPEKTKKDDTKGSKKKTKSDSKKELNESEEKNSNSKKSNKKNNQNNEKEDTKNIDKK